MWTSIEIDIEIILETALNGFEHRNHDWVGGFGDICGRLHKVLCWCRLSVIILVGFLELYSWWPELQTPTNLHLPSICAQGSLYVNLHPSMSIYAFVCFCFNPCLNNPSHTMHKDHVRSVYMCVYLLLGIGPVETDRPWWRGLQSAGYF